MRIASLPLLHHSSNHPQTYLYIHLYIHHCKIKAPSTYLSPTMRHFLFTTMPQSSSSSSALSKSTKSSSNPNSNPSFNPNHSLSCRHYPSATLDLLILIIVLFSGAFLVLSYISYIFNCISLVLSVSHSSINLPTVSLPYVFGFFFFFGVAFLLFEFCCGARSRKCDRPGCQGMKKALEFDLQLQTGAAVKSESKEIDKLPWKGGSEGNPDYECLRTELRKMAPANGRAVLLFRLRCGCPVAKLEGWGPKRGKRHKKALANVTLNGGGDRR